jgi:hypothetical protein
VLRKGVREGGGRKTGTVDCSELICINDSK